MLGRLHEGHVGHPHKLRGLDFVLTDLVDLVWGWGSGSSLIIMVLCKPWVYFFVASTTCLVQILEAIVALDGDDQASTYLCQTNVPPTTRVIRNPLHASMHLATQPITKLFLTPTHPLTFSCLTRASGRLSAPAPTWMASKGACSGSPSQPFAHISSMRFVLKYSLF
jgi:hypothetical protein